MPMGGIHPQHEPLLELMIFFQITSEHKKSCFNLAHGLNVAPTRVEPNMLIFIFSNGRVFIMNAFPCPPLLPLPYFCFLAGVEPKLEMNVKIVSSFGVRFCSTSSLAVLFSFIFLGFFFCSGRGRYGVGTSLDNLQKF